jgi:hypothetical protein
MCPQVNGILARIAGHNAEFVINLGYSCVFGLATTAAVRFQIGTFLVSPMVVTSFASVASNFLGKDHLLSIPPPVNFSFETIGSSGPSKGGVCSLPWLWQSVGPVRRKYCQYVEDIC